MACLVLNAILVFKRFIINIVQCTYKNSFAWPSALIMFFNFPLIFRKKHFNSHCSVIHQFLNFILEYWFPNSGFRLEFANKVWKAHLKLRFLPRHWEQKMECIFCFLVELLGIGNLMVRSGFKKKKKKPWEPLLLEPQIHITGKNKNADIIGD